VAVKPAVEHPHAPTVGWARRVLGAYHFSGVFWFRFPYWGMAVLQGRSFQAAVFVFTWIFFLALRQVRLAIAANLEPVLGPGGFWERRRRGFRTLQTFAWCYGERYQYLHHPERFSIEVDGLENLEAAKASGEGLVFVTAHIGHWEVASRTIGVHLKREAHVVREEELDPESQQFMQDMLRTHGEAGYTTHFASNDPGLAFELLSALRRGHVVALQGDRPRAGGKTATATVFGRPLPLPIGPAILARATGVALLPIFSFREGNFRYRVVLREPIRVSTKGDRAAAIAETVQRFATDVEWAIRREPHQWFCFRRLWS
jgi:KDO2-lipid IV(A) lauroyltransferase